MTDQPTLMTPTAPPDSEAVEIINRVKMRPKSQPVSPVADPMDNAAPGFMVDVTGWRMADHEDWQNVLATGVIKDINAEVAKIVRAWPYEGDPADLTSYRALTIAEWKETLKAVSASVSAVFQQA